MKSHYIRRNNNVHGQSFSVKHDILPHFLKLWHHHQELELVLVLQGTGTRFIGNSIEPFEPGDLVLLGDYLPHKWQSDPEYFQNNGLITEGIIVHFERSFLHDALGKTVELKGIEKLIDSAQGGIVFRGETKAVAKDHLTNILKTSPGLQRLILLLDLLRIMTNERDIEYITNPGYVNTFNTRDIKLRKVNDFVMNHFQSQISLEEVADEVNMNKSSFCRYFKKAAEKNFSNYLNEIRIGYACKLLQADTNRKIAEICYESGFNNLSNFNQKFKQQTGLTPSAYSRMIV